MQVPGRQFPTGLNFLDMRIGGGIPVDTVLTILAPPASQSQILLRALTSEQPLVYLSTGVRDTDALEAWLAEGRAEPDEVTAIHAPAESLFETLPEHLERAPPESFLVVDEINPLEAGSRSEYRTFLNDLHSWAREEDAVVFLHGLDAPETASLRSLTLNRVDQVWWLQLQLLSQDIATKLYITKARTGRALTEPISLIMTDDVRIDTSRSI